MPQLSHSSDSDTVLMIVVVLAVLVETSHVIASIIRSETWLTSKNVLVTTTLWSREQYSWVGMLNADGVKNVTYWVWVSQIKSLYQSYVL